MKQVIPFVNDIYFGTKISDITSIALEHNLKMENNDSIVGEFIISGKYKINNISINEEVFEKKLNFDITLDDKYDASKVQIDIDDFYYEIIDDEYLQIHIDVLVDNLVYVKKEKPMIQTVEEEKMILLDEFDKQLDITEERSCIMPEEENKKTEESLEEVNKNKPKEESLFNFSSGLFENEEKYSMYKVHIIRESETLDDIIKKYGVLKEELEKYNDLQNIVIGTKLVIPMNDE